MELECVSQTADERRVQRVFLDFCHTFVSCSNGSLASPGTCGLWGWPWLPQCFFQLLDLTVRFVCSGINKATSSANSTEHAPNKNGGPGIMEFWKQQQSVNELFDTH